MINGISVKSGCSTFPFIFSKGGHTTCQFGSHALLVIVLSSVGRAANGSALFSLGSRNRNSRLEHSRAGGRLLWSTEHIYQRIVFLMSLHLAAFQKRGFATVMCIDVTREILILKDEAIEMIIVVSSVSATLTTI